ncbi:hypothetical protein CLH62_14315 [Marinobacter guineae]|uniref:Uncharacterized protein n=1 Tax=Marinobacter guineae TaxID=432303 RepID=A0A2G1VFE8_9GAMM|nr:hypothetical protein [Marinobacter guineae]PHQ25493.1 hypothetical protein CLH62_14315 [Marinobacter guineae]
MTQANTVQNYQCTGTLTSEVINGSAVMGCSGGTWTVQQIQQQDIETVFAEYLSPDPEMIGLVMGSALVFWAIGIALSRVVQVMRKVT